MSQYGEPLRYVRDIDGPKLFGHASDGECLFAEICDGDVDTDVLMARAVACVNALAGVPHPDLMPKLLAACRKLAKVLAGPIDDNATITACERLVEDYAALMGETP